MESLSSVLRKMWENISFQTWEILRIFLKNVRDHKNLPVKRMWEPTDEYHFYWARTNSGMTCQLLAAECAADSTAGEVWGQQDGRVGWVAERAKGLSKKLVAVSTWLFWFLCDLLLGKVSWSRMAHVQCSYVGVVELHPTKSPPSSNDRHKNGW